LPVLVTVAVTAIVSVMRAGTTTFEISKLV
jgi:hypothetical protein